MGNDRVMHNGKALSGVRTINFPINTPAPEVKFSARVVTNRNLCLHCSTLSKLYSTAALVPRPAVMSCRARGPSRREQPVAQPVGGGVRTRAPRFTR